MDIKIDIASAKAVNERLPAVVDLVGKASDSVRALQSSIDPSVLARANLRSKLRNAQSNIQTMESDLRLLHRTIAQNIVRYEENEMSIARNVENAARTEPK